MKGFASVWWWIVLAALVSSCGPVENEFSVDEATFPLVTMFEVADSSFRENIMLRIKATIGQTTAYSFDKIQWARRDSLFFVVVLGRHKESSKGYYELVDRKLDTTLVLQSPRLGMHIFLLDERNGNFIDSTFVY
jgi:hypothetical protein